MKWKHTSQRVEWFVGNILRDALFLSQSASSGNCFMVISLNMKNFMAKFPHLNEFFPVVLHTHRHTFHGIDCCFTHRRSVRKWTDFSVLSICERSIKMSISTQWHEMMWRREIRLSTTNKWTEITKWNKYYSRNKKKRAVNAREQEWNNENVMLKHWFRKESFIWMLTLHFVHHLHQLCWGFFSS